MSKIPLTGSEREELQKLHAWLVGQETGLQSFEQNVFEKFRTSAGKYSTHQEMALRKFAELANSLTPQKTEIFRNLAISLERILDRSLVDNDFIVLDSDASLASYVTKPSLQKVYLVLENIRSAFNVGSIFRLADCLGNAEILLCGYTASPEEQSAVAKTSLGASEFVPYRQFPRLKEALETLRTEIPSVQIYALETAVRAMDLWKFEWPQGPVAFVVGNERFGLEASSLALADKVLMIPTFGIKNSMNVSQALSIASFTWRSQLL